MTDVVAVDVDVRVISRRAVVAAGLAAGVLSHRALASVPPPPPLQRTERLPVSASRTTDMTVWAPQRVRGVALLSTGHGSWPERYGTIAEMLALNGFATLAPMHVDSVRHPDRAKFTMQASFGERIADLNAAVATAAKTYPGLPIVAVGHSFGTLSALCLAGGLSYLGPFRNPAVTVVLGFSTPGRIPGLIQPTAYTTVQTPVMIVTGTADTVPGFVTDPADHLLAAGTAPTPAYALVLDGGGHELIAGTDASYARAALPARHFLAAYGLRDAAARKQLAAYKAARGDRFTFRNAA